jgi:predicted RNase H-like HicB family nuclease
MTARSGGCRVRIFPLLGYVEEALRRAIYHADENGVIIGKVPEAPGFFAEGATREEAEENLRDVIEGNILLALQLGFEIPKLPGIRIRYVETDT